MRGILLILSVTALAQDNMGAKIHTGNTVPFQTDFRIGDSLAVQYRIQNTRSKPIYLLNHTWDFDPTGNYVKAPFPAYVCVKGGRGIHIAQMLLPLPKKGRVEVRVVPFATKVDAGQTYTGTFSLPLPVKEYNAYFPETPESKTEEITVEALIFTLQFVEEAPGMTAKPSPTGEGLMIHHPQLVSALQTVQSPPYRAKIKALKRIDHFEDF